MPFFECAPTSGSFLYIFYVYSCQVFAQIAYIIFVGGGILKICQRHRQVTFAKVHLFCVTRCGVYGVLGSEGRFSSCSASSVLGLVFFTMEIRYLRQEDEEQWSKLFDGYHEFYGYNVPKVLKSQKLKNTQKKFEKLC